MHQTNPLNHCGVVTYSSMFGGIINGRSNNEYRNSIDFVDLSINWIWDK